MKWAYLLKFMLLILYLYGNLWYQQDLSEISEEQSKSWLWHEFCREGLCQMFISSNKSCENMYRERIFPVSSVQRTKIFQSAGHRGDQFSTNSMSYDVWGSHYGFFESRLKYTKFVTVPKEKIKIHGNMRSNFFVSINMRNRTISMM